MKNFKLSVTTLTELGRIVRELLELDPKKHYYVNITEKPKKRSIPANAQQHVFYKQIADFRGDQTELEVKNFCKFTFGLPIMLTSEKNEPMVSFLIEKIGLYAYRYEEQLRLMKVIVHTSDFSERESKKYMDEMISFYNEQGINIGYQEQNK